MAVQDRESEWSEAARPNRLGSMNVVADLLDHPVYGLAQVDRLLGLPGGTAKRWIEGYTRSGKKYPPVVRVEPTGEEIVTWGEFVETRLLMEYREAGVPIVYMRPAVERLREEFHAKYPLAYARPYLDVEGRELVRAVQEEVGLERQLRIVVVRNDQVVLADAAERFKRSAQFRHGDGIVETLRPHWEIQEIVLDPLRQFGEPTVRRRSVRTEVISEQVRAGDSLDNIAALYDLPRHDVEQALRYELIRAGVAA
jgi:uncharacterized protein (DUF433 family)